MRSPRAVLVAAVLALLVGAGVVAAAARPSAHVDGPIVRQVDVGGHPVTVVVTPGRPGRNLVQAFSPHGVEVRLPDGSQVDLPAGGSDIDLVVGPVSARVPLHLGGRRATGPVDEECASRRLGAALAGRAEPDCARADGDAAAVGAALVRAAAEARIAAIVIRSDDSVRGRAAARAASAAAGRRGLRARSDDAAPSGDEALVVLGGWDVARTALAAGMPGRGSLLAPWLLESGIVTGAASQVTVATAIAPASPVARAYLAALGARAPGARPSAAGLDAFAGSPVADRLQLWTPAQLAFLPRILDTGHDHAAHGSGATWLPVGDLALVRSALPLR